MRIKPSILVEKWSIKVAQRIQHHATPTNACCMKNLTIFSTQHVANPVLTVLGSPEFNFSAALVNTNWSASRQLGFLT